MKYWQRWYLITRWADKKLHDVPVVYVSLAAAVRNIALPYRVEYLDSKHLIKRIDRFPTYEAAATFYYEKLLLWTAKTTNIK